MKLKKKVLQPLDRWIEKKNSFYIFHGCWWEKILIDLTHFHSMPNYSLAAFVNAIWDWRQSQQSTYLLPSHHSEVSHLIILLSASTVALMSQLPEMSLAWEVREIFCNCYQFLLFLFLFFQTGHLLLRGQWSTGPEELWMSNPWRFPRPGWIGPRVAWSGGGNQPMAEGLDLCDI